MQPTAKHPRIATLPLRHLFTLPLGHYPSRRSLPIFAATWLAIGLVGGCAPTNQTSKTPAEVDAAEPSLNRTTGLEWRTLVTADVGVLADRLPEAENALKGDPALDRAWAASGLALWVVPADQLDALQSALLSAPITVSSADSPGAALIGGLDRRVVPQGPRYTEVAREPEPTNRTFLPLDNGRIEVRPGYLRLLTRCWVEPAPDTETAGPGTLDAALRVEIVPQWTDRAPRPTADAPTDALGALATVAAPQDQGLMLWRLRASVVVPRGSMLVMAHQRPLAPGGVNALAPRAESGSAVPDENLESALAPGSVQRRRDRAPRATPPRPTLGEDPAAGPRLETFRSTSLGEMLLTQTAPVSQAEAAAQRPRLHRVQLLVPLLPTRFELLGP